MSTDSDPHLSALLRELVAKAAEIDRRTDVLQDNLRAIAQELAMPVDCSREDLLIEVRRLKQAALGSKEAQRVIAERTTAPTVDEINRALLEGSLLLTPSGLPIRGGG